MDKLLGLGGLFDIGSAPATASPTASGGGDMMDLLGGLSAPSPAPATGGGGDLMDFLGGGASSPAPAAAGSLDISSASLNDPALVASISGCHKTEATLVIAQNPASPSLHVAINKSMYVYSPLTHATCIFCYISVTAFRSC